jgi:hypothetical protein
MAAQGLIAAKESKGQPIFGLSPFLGSVFEEQVHRLDKESATLFEQYYQETQGPGARETPAWHRVIPVAEAIPFGIEISPYEQATEILASAKSWAVRPCLCRLQQQLVGKGCGRPIGNCVVFAPTEGAFDDSKVDRPVTLEEALQLLRQAQELGLVHTLPNYRDGLDYICNCCTCCCFVLRGVAEFDVPTWPSSMSLRRSPIQIFASSWTPSCARAVPTASSAASSGHSQPQRICLWWIICGAWVVGRASRSVPPTRCTWSAGRRARSPCRQPTLTSGWSSALQREIPLEELQSFTAVSENVGYWAGIRRLGDHNQ